jgi:hypothetical protein
VYTEKSEINFSALSSMALSRWRMGTMYDDVDGPHETIAQLKSVLIDVRGNGLGIVVDNQAGWELGQLRSEGMEIQTLYGRQEKWQQHRAG